MANNKMNFHDQIANLVRENRVKQESRGNAETYYIEKPILGGIFFLKIAKATKVGENFECKIGFLNKVTENKAPWMFYYLQENTKFQTGFQNAILAASVHTI